MSGTASRFVATLAVIAAALAAVAASAGARTADPFALQLVRSSVSDSGATVVLQGTLGSDEFALGLRARVVLVATVQQRCVSADGATTTEQAVLDSITAPHFFTTTLRYLDARGSLAAWRATVTLAFPPDGSICPADEQPAAAITLESISGVSFLSPPGFGPPPAGTSLYSFVLGGGEQVLPPPQLTATAV